MHRRRTSLEREWYERLYSNIDFYIGQCVLYKYCTGKLTSLEKKNRCFMYKGPIVQYMLLHIDLETDEDIFHCKRPLSVTKTSHCQKPLILTKTSFIDIDLSLSLDLFYWHRPRSLTDFFHLYTKTSTIDKDPFHCSNTYFTTLKPEFIIFAV